jgi:hypothetical protein
MRVLAAAHDPGGANAVAATVAALRGVGHTVEAWAKGPAVRSFAALGVAARAVGVDHRALLPGPPADLLLVGTSAADGFERDLITWAGARGLPSVAVIDYWANYRARFEPRTAALGPEPWPDVITAIDARCAAEMAADGLPRDRIRIVGQPYFGWLLEHGPARPTAADGITFLSQPDLNELAALGWVIAALRACPRPPPLNIRFHPRQHERQRQPSLRALADAGLRYVVDESPAPLAAVIGQRAVLGMTTMLLAEAALMGVPAGSVLAGVADTLATNRDGLTTALRSPEEVAAFLTAPSPPAPSVLAERQRGAHRRAAALCEQLALRPTRTDTVRG